MIALRICRRCRKEFEAEVGVDRNIYCERCRDLMSFIEDEERYRDEDNSIPTQEELSTVDDALLAGIQKNLQAHSIKGMDIDSGRSFRSSSSKKTTPPKNLNHSSNNQIDPETLAFLDSMEIDIDN